MSSENILTNSPALNSLKRAQLVGLCKRYGLRASGKNVELIARLQEHGRSGAMTDLLGNGTLLHTDDEGESVADPNDSENELQNQLGTAPRPSEAWSVVDEPSDVETNMPGTLPTINEFGGGGASMKSSSMSSSIKLLAASLLPGSSARSKASMPPTMVEPPHSELPYMLETAQIPDNEPEPQQDYVDTHSPTPPAIPEDIDLGASTIRLVAPSRKLKSSSPPSSPEYANPSPFKGKSIMGLPPSSSQLHLPLPFASSSAVNLFGSSTGHGFSKSTPPELMSGTSKPLYSSLNPSMRSIATMTSDSFSIPGTFPEPPARSYPAYATTSPRASKIETGIPTHMDPDFSFRVPMPKASEDDKEKETARAAVLAEMRRRMAEEASVPAGDFSFVTLPAPSGGAAKKRGRDDEEETEKAANTPSSALASKFDSAHRKQFDKMASIADHYAARRPNPSPRKSTAGSRPSSNGYPRARTSMLANRAGAKRQSTAALRLSALQATTPRNSTLVPDERPGKRARVSKGEDVITTSGPQANATPTVSSPIKPHVRISDIQNPNKLDVTVQTKKKADAAAASARARRKSRSSMGRQSLSRNAVLGVAPPKPKGITSRFGFLKSSAKLVKSVYASVVGGGNGDGSSSAPSTKADNSSAKSKKSISSSIPASTLAPAKPAARPSVKAQPVAAAARPSTSQPTKSAAAVRRSSKVEATPIRSQITSPPGPSSASASAAPHGITRKGSNSSRPGIPTWNSTAKTDQQALSTTSGSVAGSVSSRHSRAPSLTSTMRTETTTMTTPASSMGLKRTSSSRSSAGFAAPTVSSLARAAANAKASAQTHAQSGIRPPSISSRKAFLDSVPEGSGAIKVQATSPQTPRPRPLPTPTPNKFGFVGGVTPSTSITSTRFLLSPSSATPSTTPGSRPLPTPTLKSGIPQPFSFTSPPTAHEANSEVVLSPRENVTFSAAEDTEKTPTKSAPSEMVTEAAAPASLLPRSTSNASTVNSAQSNSLRKRPRISRSKVIAKLGEKRAAEDAAKLPVQTLRAKTRSSVGAGLAAKSADGKTLPSRRSFMTSGTTAISASPRASGLARKERAVMESWHRGQRKSEAAARRRSSRAQTQNTSAIAERSEDMDL